MDLTTWKKGYHWEQGLRVCGFSVASGTPVYDTLSGPTNVIKKTEAESWICSRTGFQVKKNGKSFELSHPSLNEGDLRTFPSWDDAVNGIWEFTCINVYCDWHKRRKFQKMLSELSVK